MKTFLKVLLGVAVCFVAIHFFPLLLVPVIFGVAVTLIVGSALVGGLAALLATTLSLLAGLLVVMLVALAVLSPIWLPILAIVGLISLCRKSQPPLVSAA